MFRYFLHSNLIFEVSLNPITWYILPKVQRAKYSAAYPHYKGANIMWLFLRVYAYVDDGAIDVVAMYEQQEREQNFVPEA